VVQNAEQVIVISVDLYFEAKPTATNNKSGITNPGVTVYFVPTKGNSVPDLDNIDRYGVARVEYAGININAPTTPQANWVKTNFKFNNPVVATTGAMYAFVIAYDGNEDFFLWTCRQNDVIVGTSTKSPGSFARNIGAYYEYKKGSGGVGIDWIPVTNEDLMFTAYVGRYNISTSGANAAVNPYTVSFIKNKNPQEFVVYDRYNSYETAGGRYSKNGGNSQITTVGYKDGDIASGDLIYQVTPIVPGNLIVNSSSRIIKSDGSINFNSLYKANPNNDMYIVLVQNNYMGTDTRSFNNRPKFKYPTGSWQYDPYRSDTDVRKIVSIDSNTQITVDTNPTFSDNTAKMCISPVGQFYFADNRFHHPPDWDYDQLDSPPLDGVKKLYDAFYMTNSNANSTVRFVNNTIEYISLNLPIVSYQNIFAVSNGAVSTPMYDVQYGNGAFVAVGENLTIQSSNNAATWTSRYQNTSSNTSFYAVSYGNGIFFAVGGSSNIWTSTNNAVTWTQATTPNQDGLYTLRGAAYGNGVYIAVGRFGYDRIRSYVLSSTDTITWTQRSWATSNTDGALRGAAYGNGVYVAVGDNNFVKSKNGTTWTVATRDTAGPIGQFFDVAYGNGLFVAVGTAGIQTSSDGSTWTFRAVTPEKSVSYLFGVTYGDGVFMASGGMGTKHASYTMVSTDGINWSLRDMPANLTKKNGRQAVLRGMGFGSNTFVGTALTQFVDIGDIITSSAGQFVYANSASVLTLTPGANTESATGSGYSNTDFIEIYAGNGYSKSVNAYANVITNNTGAIVNTSITNPGYGFYSYDTVTNVKYNIKNSSNAASSGTGANLFFSVGSTLRSEHSGIVFSNTVMVDQELSKLVPSVSTNKSKSILSIDIKYSTPWFRASNGTVTYGGYNGIDHPTPVGLTINPSANTLTNFGNTLMVMSRSNEVYQEGVVIANNGSLTANNKTVLTITATSNNDFEVPVTSYADVYAASYYINNDATLENTRHGNAVAKHITTKINFANNQSAEDVVAYVNAYRPIDTDVYVYVKIHNKDDPEPFDDKDWTLLEYKTNQSRYSSSTDLSNIVEYQLGFPASPPVVFTSQGVVTAANGSTNIVGIGTTFGLDYRVGDIVKISSPLFPTNYQIAVVNTIDSDTSININDSVLTQYGVVGSGLNISLVGRAEALSSTGYVTARGTPYQAFTNKNNNNVVRYYNGNNVTFDTYDTMQFKIVLLAKYPSVVPMVASIRAIGVSA